MEQPDSAVIAASRADPEIFGVLFDRHAASLLRFLARRLDPGDAEDLLSEVYRIAFERRGDYDLARASARPWLYGIAANVIGKHRRAEVRMLRALARTGVDPVADGHADRVDSRVCAAAVQRDLAAALAGLPAGDRDVLLLIAWADLSYEETAAALGIPVGTVRSRLNRARRKVREALGGQNPTSSNQELDP